MRETKKKRWKIREGQITERRNERERERERKREGGGKGVTE